MATHTERIAAVGTWQEIWDRTEWAVYGAVRIHLADGRTADVGITVGVPEHLRATAQAAGGDVTRPAYLGAWYGDASDCESAPLSDGSEAPDWLCDAASDALSDAAVRLWRDAQEQDA